MDNKDISRPDKPYDYLSRDYFRIMGSYQKPTEEFILSNKKSHSNTYQISSIRRDKSKPISLTTNR